MTTKKTKALTRQTVVDKVMSLLFNMLSRLVITFLSRSRHLLTSWLQSPSAVILEPQNSKLCHYFHCFSIYLPLSNGTRCHDLCFLNVELHANFFTLLFKFHQEALQFFFTFCDKGGIICISEILITISNENKVNRRLSGILYQGKGKSRHCYWEPWVRTL